MRVLGTLLKVVVSLMLLIPVSLLVLGIFGTVMGLAVMFVRLALIGLMAFGAFKLIGRLTRGRGSRAERSQIPRLAPVDPYYQAAMRELDRDLA